MAKHTRWAQFEVPLIVRVELDDEYDDDRVAQVVLGLPEGTPYDGVELAPDWQGRYRVSDGGPDADMARTCADDALGRAAVGLAEQRQHWPDRHDWQEGPDPRRHPGLYDEPDDESDEPERASLR
ncbi:hypothetical protein ACFXPA_48575 [Amycolatopsis sp. NPDC059090]|uniref:hypothetical protein n=1 Tax=Amycolatopsis sp. NPDC059090 TaxID=3346723 RepID=UPI0036727000